jgi:hypothetical protein
MPQVANFLQVYYTSNIGTLFIAWVQAHPFLFTGAFVLIFAIALTFVKTPNK